MNNKEVNKFIGEHLDSINTKYRQKYHFMGQVGWINDPNGFIYLDGYYHLFYQYVPYDGFQASDGACWGHARSKDLFKWEYLPVAIVPSEPYDRNGCWSGSSIYVNGVFYLFYAGHYAEGDVQRETVNIAYSHDGINFIKYENNPVIIPDSQYTSTRDFRDPYIFVNDGHYYILVGTNKNDKPCIALYRSENLFKWEFISYFYKNPSMGTNLECPSFTENKYFICSPQNVPIQGFDHFNVSSSIFVKGEFIDEKFIEDKCFEIDHGLEFYAPQSTVGENGKTIMMTWFQMWGRKYVNQSLDNKWEGCMTLPRIVEYKNDHLYQHVVPAIEKYLGSTNRCDLINKTLVPTASYLFVDNIEDDLSIFIGKEDDYFQISYSKESDALTISRKNAKIPLGGVDNSLSTEGIRMVNCHSKGKLKLEIYLDTISNEIFINDGVETMSSLFYLDNDEKYVWSDKSINAEIKEININKE